MLEIDFSLDMTMLYLRYYIIYIKNYPELIPVFMLIILIVSIPVCVFNLTREKAIDEESTYAENNQRIPASCFFIELDLPPNTGCIPWERTPLQQKDSKDRESIYTDSDTMSIELTNHNINTMSTQLVNLNIPMEFQLKSINSSVPALKFLALQAALGSPRSTRF